MYSGLGIQQQTAAMGKGMDLSKTSDRWFNLSSVVRKVGALGHNCFYLNFMRAVSSTLPIAAFQSGARAGIDQYFWLRGASRFWAWYLRACLHVQWCPFMYRKVQMGLLLYSARNEIRRLQYSVFSVKISVHWQNSSSEYRMTTEYAVTANNIRFHEWKSCTQLLTTLFKRSAQRYKAHWFGIIQFVG